MWHKHCMSALVLLMASSAAASACDSRHFYNHSDVFWTVSLQQGICRPPGGPDAPTCGVPPGATAVLSYPDNPFAASAITITSSYYYPPRIFFVDGVSCYINHDGNTGNIVVNDPANGDVQTCGEPGYSCTNTK